MATRIKESNKNLTILRLDGGGIPIYEYEGKPFTGIVYIEHENAIPAVETEYKNGYQEGWTRTYHKNGKLKREFKSHNNMMIEGSFKKWDENGHLIESF